MITCRTRTLAGLVAVVALVGVGSTMVAPAEAGEQVPLPAEFTCDEPSGTYEVRRTVTKVVVDVWGARGGRGATAEGTTSSGGYGGHITAVLDVDPYSELQVIVGCRGGDGALGAPGAGGTGFRAGGPGGTGTAGTGGGGGGATAIRTPEFDETLIVAGGGGGNGGAEDADGGYGGYAFGSSLVSATSGLPSSCGGGGGGRLGGDGAGGSGSTAHGEPGSAGVGGAGAANATGPTGGGGGGGYTSLGLGGGGGGGVEGDDPCGGGGGAGFVAPLGVSEVRGLPSAAFDGRVRIVVYEVYGEVALGHPFYDEIVWMAHQEISDGYDDGTFRPGAPVTRQAMSAFLYRFADEPPFTAPGDPTFTDVAADHPFYDEIEWMADQGITDGYDDGTFRSGAHVTRQAMSAFLYRFADEPPFTAPDDPTFTDVAADHPFYDEIEWMADQGITDGYDDATYRPAAPVTRQAMSAFLKRVSELPT